MWNKIALLVLVVMMYTLPTWGATYTVCSSGCTKTTIQAVFDDIVLAPNDIVEVQADTPGGSKTYNEQITWGSDDIGDNTGDVTLKTRDGDSITIAGEDTNHYCIILTDIDYVTIDGFTLTGAYTNYRTRGAIWATTSDNITVQNCIISGSTRGSGIALDRCDSFTIYNNTISTCYYDGIILYAQSNDICQNGTISNNTTHTNNEVGIFLLGQDTTYRHNNITVSENISYNNGTGIYLKFADGCTVSSNIANDNTDPTHMSTDLYGIGLTRSSGNTIENNIMDGNGNGGIEVWGGSDGLSSSNILRKNTILNTNNTWGRCSITTSTICDEDGDCPGVETCIKNFGNGIWFSGGSTYGTGNQAYYNIIYDNARSGIRVGLDNTDVWNNDCYSNDEYGVHIQGIDGTDVKNNILNDNVSFDLYHVSATNTTMDYNLYDRALGDTISYNATGCTPAEVADDTCYTAIFQEQNGVGSDPSFVNASADNFRLQSGSSAINTGDNVGLTVDIQGKALVGVPDIGAIEGSQNYYYMNASGTITNKGRALNCSSALAMDLTTHNAETFSPGDIINLCDDDGEYREEQLIPPSSGSSGNVITYKNAPGDNPEIYGSANGEEETWSLVGGNIYKTATDSFEAIVGEVFYNTESTPVRATEEDTSSTCGGVDGALNTDWDWCYHDTDDCIYMYHSSGTPEDQTVGLEIQTSTSAGDEPIYIDSLSYILVDGIAVKYAGSNAITFIDSTNITANDCTISYSGSRAHDGDGLTIKSSGTTVTDITVSNCTVTQIYDIGISIQLTSSTATAYDIWFTDNNVSYSGAGLTASCHNANGSELYNVYIRDNTVTNMGYGFSGVDNNVFGKGIGIKEATGASSSYVHDIYIEDNIIDTFAWAGVTYANEGHAYVRYNIITNGGTVYTVSPPAAIRAHGGSHSETDDEATGVIAYNLIYNNNGHGICILNNTPPTSPAEYLDIYNNVLYNNGDTTDYDGIKFITSNSSNIRVKNNIIYSTNANLFAMSTESNVDADYNLYFNDTATNDLWEISSTGYNRDSEWASYKSASGQESNSLTPADPSFVNASSGNFHRTTSTAGTDVGLTSDYEGSTVSTPNIGAFENTFIGYYVRPTSGEYGAENGSTYKDAFDGDTDVNWATVLPGQTLFVCGTHTEEILVDDSGTSGNLQYIYSCETQYGATVDDPGIIDGQDTLVDCLDLGNSRDYIHVEGLTIRDCLDFGIKLRGNSDNNVIQGNIISDIGTTYDEPQAGGIQVFGSNNTIRNNTITNCMTHGIRVVASWASSNDNIIESNVITDCWHTSIETHINNDETDVTLDGTVIKKNIISWTSTEDQAVGIYVHGGDLIATDPTLDLVTNISINYNTIRGSPLYGIQVQENYENVYLYNNTISGSASVDVYFNDYPGTIIVINNIGSSSGITANVRLVETSPASKTFDDNIWYGGTYLAQIGSPGSEDNVLLSEWNGYSYVEEDIVSDPLFVSTTDLRLASALSPAFNSGTDVSISEDILGNPVPIENTVDIGAYEYYDGKLSGIVYNWLGELTGISHKIYVYELTGSGDSTDLVPDQGWILYTNSDPSTGIWSMYSGTEIQAGVEYLIVYFYGGDITGSDGNTVNNTLQPKFITATNP